MSGLATSCLSDIKYTPRLGAMYLRFTVSERDSDSGAPKGLFMAAYDLLDDAELEDYERIQLRELLDWFGENLRPPPCLKEGRYPAAVCWFDPEATEHVRRMWRLVWVLRGRGRLVKLHKTSHPGHFVYVDNSQVAAIPFAQQPRRRRHVRC
jgi:hypothetical protein